MQLPASEPVTVRDELDLVTLVAYLRRETRERPVLVLTVAPGQPGPFLSASTILKDAGGRVDVVIVPTDHLTRQLTDKLSVPEAGVYRGACRVYPPGTAWETRPHCAPLRMTRDKGEIEALPRLIDEDLQRALSRVPAPAAAAPRTGAAPVSPGRPSGTPTPPSAPRVEPEIATAEDATALADYLRSPARQHPSVVVSRATGTREAYADVRELRESLSGLADVVEIVTLKASWAFSHAVPDMCQVYGGASRVYPIGRDWETQPYVSPLRFAYGRPDRDQVTRLLIADAMTMASRGNHTVPAGQARTSTVTGQVSGVAGGRAFVGLEGQMPGTVWPELIEPGLPAERLFAKGMQLTGLLDPDSRRIDVTLERIPAEQALASYREGDTVLARVSEVTPDTCTVELFPGQSHLLPADCVVDSPTDLRELMSVGEVLPVWFGGRDEGEWLLSLRDAADAEEAVPAPSIFPGGPPWLVPDSAAQRRPNELGPALREPGSLAVEPTRELVEGLLHENELLAGQARAKDAEIEALQQELAVARTRRREAVRRRSTASEDGYLFEDPAEQLDFEIKLAWARMISPQEKARLPLRRWSYSDHFIDTLHEVQGVSREKVVEVIVHILTGRDVELDSRERHQLRTGSGGDDPPRVRQGGETCWRVSLQVKTPGARRLHYWMCSDGSIELSSVRTHDDFRT